MYVLLIVGRYIYLIKNTNSQSYTTVGHFKHEKYISLVSKVKSVHKIKQNGKGDDVEMIVYKFSNILHIYLLYILDAYQEFVKKKLKNNEWRKHKKY